MNREELKWELIYSLPSKALLYMPSNLAVENPKNGELIVLKQRPEYESFPLSNYIRYNERHDAQYDYKELKGKSVIIDFSLLGTRGEKALEII